MTSRRVIFSSPTLEKPNWVGPSVESWERKEWAWNLTHSRPWLPNLADFGVAGQLTDTMAKRNTVREVPRGLLGEATSSMVFLYIGDRYTLLDGTGGDSRSGL